MEERYMDTSLTPKERAEALYGLLSREEKFAQIQNFELSYDDALRRDFYSEVGIGFLSAEWMQDCKTIEEAVALQRDLQLRAIEQSPHHIPAVFYVHAIAGAHLPDATTFPSDLNRGAAYNVRLEERIGAIVARQAMCLGVNYIVAPIMDISADYYVEKKRKTYSEARAIGVIMGSAFAKGIREESLQGLHAEILSEKDSFDWDNLTEDRLEELVKNVLEMKFHCGLFENPFGLQEKAAEFYHDNDDYEVARIGAEESYILLKNDGVLPLRREDKVIALIGPHAQDVSSYYMNEKSVKASTVSLLECMQTKRGKDTILYSRGYEYEGSDEAYFAQALEAIKNANVAVVTLGSRYEYWNHEMGAMDITENCGILPPVQERFIEEAKKLGVPLIGVHFGVHPLASNTAPALLNGLIEALLPAEATADAVYDILTGKVNPGGRLPYAVLDADTKELRLPFGHGLSFSKFSVTDLAIDKAQTLATEPFEISFYLRNEGPIAGNETIQLYLREQNEESGEDLKLIGMRKVFFLSGEGHKLAFIVSPAQLAVLSEQGDWEVKPGVYQFYLGRSVSDFIGSVEIEITGNDKIDGPERVFYSESHVYM